jgi:hypothetical protein
MTRFLGSNILVNFLVATVVGSASLGLGYLFSEDWRTLILAQMNRVRVVLGSLTNRAKPSAPANTNPQNSKDVRVERLTAGRRRVSYDLAQMT